MPGITGLGSTFDLPNFVGDLFTITPEETPLLTAMGGLTGGRETADTSFEWQFYDLRDADSARQRLEGDAARFTRERVRANADNVLEIHQESVSISYSKLGTASGNYATTHRGPNPVTDELRWQMDQQIKQVARDVEVSFIVGTYAKPNDNTQPRTTRG